MRKFLATLGMTAVAASGAQAQFVEPTTAPQQNEVGSEAAGSQGPGIVVIGNRIPDEEVSDYISDVLFPERIGAVKFYPRQGDPLCPAVIGLEDEVEAFVENRMKQVAEAAGIDVAENEDCKFNLVLALVDDGPDTIKRWRTQWNRRAFGNIPPHDRDTVQRMDGPAYSWNVVGFGNGLNLGSPVGSTALLNGIGPLDGLVLNEPQFNPRLRLAAPEVIEASFVLVEREALKDITATQLADFALMRGMMRVQHKLGSARKADTILNLFDQNATPAERQPSVTRLDLAMLVSLYSARADVGAGRQRSDMLKPFQRVMAYGEEGLDRP